MPINVSFQNALISFTKTKYRQRIGELLDNATNGLSCSKTVYFSESSESVYVIVKFTNKEGYLLFTIKSHKEYRPTSVKVFNTDGYRNLTGLGFAIRKYIEDTLKGKHALFKFKYANYLGLKSIVSLTNRGYEIVTTKDNYIGSLNENFYIEVQGSRKRTEITDKAFISRLVTLVYCGLVRGYVLRNGFVRFYITDFGFKILNENSKTYFDKFQEDYRNNALDGMIEREVVKAQG